MNITTSLLGTSRLPIPKPNITSHNLSLPTPNSYQNRTRYAPSTTPRLCSGLADFPFLNPTSPPQPLLFPFRPPLRRTIPLPPHCHQKYSFSTCRLKRHGTSRRSPLNQHTLAPVRFESWAAQITASPTHTHPPAYSLDHVPLTLNPKP